MGFDVQLDSRGGRPNPDYTRDRWDTEFIRTVNGKARGGFTLSRYKDIINRNGKWGSGVIRYRDPWAGNWSPDVILKRNQGGNIYYDVAITELGWSGNAKVYYALGNTQVHPIETNRQNIHRIMDCGGHPDSIQNYVAYVKENQGFGGVLRAVYNGAIESGYIVAGSNDGTDVTLVTHFPEFNFTYRFSNGVEGYTQSIQNRIVIPVPDAIKNDPNAWVMLIPNEWHKGSGDLQFRPSQRFPFNTRSTNVFTNVIASNRLEFGNFNPSRDWYITNAWGSRSGNTVTVTVKYVSNIPIRRATLVNGSGSCNVNVNANTAIITVSTSQRALVIGLHTDSNIANTVAIYVD